MGLSHWKPRLIAKGIRYYFVSDIPPAALRRAGCRVGLEIVDG